MAGFAVFNAVSWLVLYGFLEDPCAIRLLSGTAGFRNMICAESLHIGDRAFRSCMSGEYDRHFRGQYLPNRGVCIWLREVRSVYTTTDLL